jgi:hypothetical protein
LYFIMQVRPKSSRPKTTTNPKPSRPRPASTSSKQTPTPVGRLIREVSHSIGAAYGGPLGGALARKAGAAISRISGFGDYTVTNNSLARSGQILKDGQVPKFVVNGNVTTVSHRDYIMDLVSPGTGFSASQFVVNPGAASTFPWLSLIGSRFQKYRFRGLIFEFVTTSSEYASGAALGTVVIASNYNAYDLPYTTKAAMENSAFAVSCKPSCSMIHPIECSPVERSQDWYYTRDGVNGVNAIQLYDLCQTTIATQGISAPNGTVLGEIWVSYVVDFVDPILPPSLSSIQQAGLVLTSAGNYNHTGSGLSTGPLFTSTDLGFLGGMTISAISNPNGLSALTISSMFQPGPLQSAGQMSTGVTGGFPGAVVIVNSSGVTSTTTTANASAMSFPRAGTYLFNTNVSVLSASALGAPWTITGSGATSQVLIYSGASAGANNQADLQILITVPAYPPGFIPWLIFTSNNTGTFQYASFNFSILS